MASEANLAGARGATSRWRRSTPAARRTCWSAPPGWRSSSIATCRARSGSSRPPSRSDRWNAGLLLTKGNFLMFAGRLEESLRRAGRRPPGSTRATPASTATGCQNLAAARRPARDAARAARLRLAVPGPALPGRVPRSRSPASTGALVGRSGAAARRRRTERDAVGRVRPAALRGTATRTCATRLAAAGGRRVRRSTARSAARVGASLKPVGGAPRLGAARSPAMPGGAAREGRRARGLSSSGCRRPPGTSGGAGC